MMDLKSLVNFFDTKYILKWLYRLLLMSLIPLGDIYLLILLSEIWGVYLILGICSSISFVGLFIAYSEICGKIKKIKQKMKNGTSQLTDIKALAGMIFGTALLVLPGFITDGLGLLILISPLKRAAGFFIFKKLGTRADYLSEYLQLQALKE